MLTLDDHIGGLQCCMLQLQVDYTLIPNLQSIADAIEQELSYASAQRVAHAAVEDCNHIGIGVV